MERARNPEQKAMRREKNQRRRRRSRESTEKQSSGHFPPTCCTTTSDGQFFNRSTQVRQSKPNERVLDLSLPDLSKLIGEEWKNMSDDSKNTWKEKARGLKLDFEMKMLHMKNKEKDD